MQYDIALQSITLEPREGDGSRIGTAVWRLSRNDRNPIDLPVQFFLENGADDADAIRYARAVLHNITHQIADQTKGWALP